MIKSFKCNDTEKIFDNKYSRKLDSIARQAKRKLNLIADAIDLNDLKVPPGNRLEALEGNRKGQYSIRINHQWRVCFKWNDGNAHDAEIVDYH